MNMAPLLLAALQVHAGAEGLVEVTVAQLAHTLGSSERQVQRLLRLLETSGAITALCKTGGRGKPAQYRVSTPGGRSPVTHSTPNGDAPALSALKGDISISNGDAPGTLSISNGDAPGTLSGQPPLFSPPLPPTPP
jgi:hypothetical protein